MLVYDFDMTGLAAEKVAALLGVLPRKWTLTGSIWEDDAAQEAERRKRKNLERRAKRQGSAQRIANRLILKGHVRRAKIRLMNRGVFEPGRRYDRFRELDVITADRLALCSVAAGSEWSLMDLFRHVGATKRYGKRDIVWAEEQGYFEQAQVSTLQRGKRVLRRVLWRRTAKPYQGYVPDPKRATVHRNRAMTQADREAALAASVAESIVKVEAAAARMVQSREGKAIAPFEQRRRRYPPADWKRIQAVRAQKAARSSAGIKLPSRPGRPRTRTGPRTEWRQDSRACG